MIRSTILLVMLVPITTCNGVCKQTQQESAEVSKCLKELSSDNPSLRKAAFLQLKKTPPLSMAPLIDIVRKMKPVVSPDGKLNYYTLDSTPHFAIMLLGHYRAKEAIGPLIEQIGYMNYDQISTYFPEEPTVVKALASIGKDVIPAVIKKLASIDGDGIRRAHCLRVLLSLNNYNCSDVFILIKTQSEKKGWTEAEIRNLRDVLTYFYYSEERKQYEFRDKDRPPLTADSDYWRK